MDNWITTWIKSTAYLWVFGLYSIALFAILVRAEITNLATAASSAAVFFAVIYAIGLIEWSVEIPPTADDKGGTVTATMQPIMNILSVAPILLLLLNLLIHWDQRRSKQPQPTEWYYGRIMLMLLIGIIALLINHSLNQP